MVMVAITGHPTKIFGEGVQGRPCDAMEGVCARDAICHAAGGDALLTSAGLQPSGPSLTLLRGEVPVQVCGLSAVMSGVEVGC